MTAGSEYPVRVKNMTTDNSTVPQRLELIEELSRETRDALREVLGGVAKLTERSEAQTLVISELRGEIRQIASQQQAHATEIAKISAMEKSLHTAHSEIRSIVDRVVKLETEDARQGVITGITKWVGGQTGGLIFGLIAAGLIYIFGQFGRDHQPVNTTNVNVPPAVTVPREKSNEPQRDDQ